ncbi:unnamed protein product [Diplocarpon coronariae]
MVEAGLMHVVADFGPSDESRSLAKEFASHSVPCVDGSNIDCASCLKGRWYGMFGANDAWDSGERNLAPFLQAPTALSPVITSKLSFYRDSQRFAATRQASAKMLETLPIVLIVLCAVILAIGFSALMNIVLKNRNARPSAV